MCHRTPIFSDFIERFHSEYTCSFSMDVNTNTL